MYFVRLLVFGPAFEAAGYLRRNFCFAGDQAVRSKRASRRNSNEAGAAEHGLTEPRSSLIYF